MLSRVPNILYHYCSLEAFYNIVVNKSLWLSDSYCTNDYMENKWIYRKLNTIRENPINSEKLALLDEAIRFFEINSYIPFISCFSEEPDLLSQWRSYAHDGEGVAIGFNTKYFNIKQHLPYTMSVFGDRSIGIYNVIYEDADQVDLLQQVVNMNMPAHDLGIKIKQFSFIFKNAAFREEKEWRIIHTPLILGSHTDGSTQILGGISACNFRTTQNDLIPYFILPFSEVKSESPISEIYIGPRSNVLSYKIETFLSLNNIMNTPIKRSRASYR